VEDEFEITGDVEQDPATRKFDAIIGRGLNSSTFQLNLSRS
jgi:hypothetical protein